MRVGKVVLVILFVISIASIGLAEEMSVGEKCINCHMEKSLGLYKQWKGSKHGQNDITCYDCHQAEKGDLDGYMHNDAFISTLVTPKDCGQCHEQEAAQVQASYHASAGEILNSADAYLAHVAGGDPVAVTGCEQCHGSKVEIDPESPNMLSKKSFPNSGIGRLNPDGSRGTCNACHSRHSFSRAQARQPENCGKCHLGPDHPQKEIYEESKHGIAYYAHKDDMALDSESWVVGVDYYEAPTCATCHMSATQTQKLTHDVGDRLSWTLRPPVSKHKDNWEAKRGNMIDVCTACHSTTFAEGHYYQFDGLVNLYNEKFARPAGEVMKILRKNNSLPNPASFSNKVEWIYWEIWHHEGRRARHGAAMMGPDYTWWHGIYEVAQHYYFKFIPEVRKLHDAEADAFLDKQLTDDPMHNWMSRPTADLKADIRSGKMKEIYSELFQSAMPGTVPESKGH
ncbi:MAG: multiheme c-type cytochrome [Candidatus Electryonea clarkiae]|nr:multiheme c-type cytochrome [Candidatus Electryonea clarkiae]MDP8289092.1 multiheme c-type cytochrome [Candidatus Electryonea clarkiae]